MYLTHKVELIVDDVIRAKLEKCLEVARITWNWGLAKHRENWFVHKKWLSHFDLCKLQNESWEKEFPWFEEVSSHVRKYALMNVTDCINGKVNKRKFQGRFRREGTQAMFMLEARYCKVSRVSVILPKIGEVKFREKGYADPAKKYSVAKIMKHGDRWFIGLVYEVSLPERPIGDPVTVNIGLDAIVTSRGDRFEHPREFERSKKRIQRLHRRVMRKMKGSQNQQKAIAKFRKAHDRVVCIRDNAIHQATTRIVKSGNPSKIIVNKLKVIQAVRRAKSKHTRIAIYDISFGKICNCLDYKAFARSIEFEAIETKKLTELARV